MNILIVTNGGIGDQIHFSSLIGALKKKHQDSNITIFCHPNMKFIYENDKNIFKITDAIENEEFDLGFNFALRNELLDIFDEIKITERVGFIRNKKEIAKNETATFIQKGVTGTNLIAKKLMNIVLAKIISDKTLSEWICEIAGLDWEKPYFAYLKNEKFKELSSRKEVIVIQYGTNTEEKNWPKEYYKKLIEYFRTFSIVYITGHKKYENDIKEFEYEDVVRSLVGDYNDLYEVANLLSYSTLLISPDTSVAQIGIALGIKTIVLSNRFDRGFTLSNKFENLMLIEEDLMKDIEYETVILTSMRLL